MKIVLLNFHPQEIKVSAISYLLEGKLSICCFVRILILQEDKRVLLYWHFSTFTFKNLNYYWLHCSLNCLIQRSLTGRELSKNISIYPVCYGGKAKLLHTPSLESLEADFFVPTFNSNFHVLTPQNFQLCDEFFWLLQKPFKKTLFYQLLTYSCVPFFSDSHLWDKKLKFELNLDSLNFAVKSYTVFSQVEQAHKGRDFAQV